MKAKDLANNPQGEEQNSTDEFYWWKTITNRFHQEGDEQDVSKTGELSYWVKWMVDPFYLIFEH